MEALEWVRRCICSEGFMRNLCADAMPAPALFPPNPPHVGVQERMRSYFAIMDIGRPLPARLARRFGVGRLVCNGDGGRWGRVRLHVQAA